MLGHISAEQFQTLSGSYTEEQEKVAVEIPAKEAAIQKLRDTVSSTDGFIGGDIQQGKESPRQEISAYFLPGGFL